MASISPVDIDNDDVKLKIGALDACGMFDLKTGNLTEIGQAYNKEFCGSAATLDAFVRNSFGSGSSYQQFVSSFVSKCKLPYQHFADKPIQYGFFRMLIVSEIEPLPFRLVVHKPMKPYKMGTLIQFVK